MEQQSYLCFMPRIAAISLLVVFLTSNTEFHELMKLGAFVSHYAEHKVEDPGLSLSEFIRIHYEGEVKYDEDYGRDMQLPFKTADCVSLTAPCTLPVASLPALHHPLPAVKCARNFFARTVRSLSGCTDIWEPPKSA